MQLPQSLDGVQPAPDASFEKLTPDASCAISPVAGQDAPADGCPSLPRADWRDGSAVASTSPRGSRARYRVPRRSSSSARSPGASRLGSSQIPAFCCGPDSRSRSRDARGPTTELSGQHLRETLRLICEPSLAVPPLPFPPQRCRAEGHGTSHSCPSAPLAGLAARGSLLDSL
jgi:hypothetical protein